MFAFKCREVSYLGPESKNSMKKCLFLFLYSYTADIEKKKEKNKPWSIWVQIMPRLIVFLSLDVLSW